MVSPAKTPTSSLTGNPTTHFLSFRSLTLSRFCTTTATELFINRLWYRTKAKIVQFLLGGIEEIPKSQSSPFTRLPQEVVEIIISYFTYDLRTLIACSLTCHSWYIAAVPLLHHTLTTDGTIGYSWGETKRLWPKPLRHSYYLGLLPLVKRFRIRQTFCFRPEDLFGSNRFSQRTLCYFSAFTSLQELGMDDLQISTFMPNIKEYFGHLSPNLRSLALVRPTGSCREILYFIGLFPNLQDLKLHYDVVQEQENEDHATPPPLSVPPLQGQLTLTCFGREKLMEEMINHFGGLHFRFMDLFRVNCARLLLSACAGTLETLRLYVTDQHCKGYIFSGKKGG